MIGHLVPGMPWMSDGTLTPLQDQAVWQFRVPRSLLAALSGAGPALAGAMMQAVVRNPLAEPYILGASSGASVGAVLVIVSGGATFLGLTMSGAAFVGAMVACILAGDARAHPRRAVADQDDPRRCRTRRPAECGDQLPHVATTDAQNVVSVMFFLLGSVSAADMSSLLIPAVALADRLHRRVRALAVDERTARGRRIRDGGGRAHDQAARSAARARLCS